MSWPGHGPGHGLPPGWNPQAQQNGMMGMSQGQTPNQQGYSSYGQQQSYQQAAHQNANWGGQAQPPQQPGPNPYGQYSQTGQPQQNGQFGGMAGYGANQYGQMSDQSQMAQFGMNPMMTGYPQPHTAPHHHQGYGGTPSGTPKSQHQSQMPGHQPLGHPNYNHQAPFPNRNGPSMVGTPVSQQNQAPGPPGVNPLTGHQRVNPHHPGVPGNNSTLTELLQNNPQTTAAAPQAPQRPRAPSQTNVTSVYGQSMATPSLHAPSRSQPSVPSSQAISQSSLNGSNLYNAPAQTKMFNNQIHFMVKRN